MKSWRIFFTVNCGEYDVEFYIVQDNKPVILADKYVIIDMDSILITEEEI